MRDRTACVAGPALMVVNRRKSRYEPERGENRVNAPILIPRSGFNVCSTEKRKVRSESSGKTVSYRPARLKSARSFRARGVEMDTGSLGSFIRAQRKQLRLTQLEVAELADVSDRFIRELEKGKSTAEIGKVIKVLGVLGYDLVPVLHRTDPL